MFMYVWLATAFLIILFLIKRYFELLFLKKGEEIDDKDLPFVSIIVPARNEEENIKRCVLSLLRQDYPKSKFEVVVVDDKSEDGTGEIVKRIAKDYSNLKLVRNNKLEDGWTGKCYACHVGYLSSSFGDFLCFIDADTESKPDLLKTAVSYAVKNKISMLSLNPHQRLETFVEKFLMPAIFFIIALRLNLKKTNQQESKEALANGQFILIRRDVYEKVGGHEAIKGEIVDDIALARLVKSYGETVFFLEAADFISTRMYKNLSEIMAGMSKNIALILGGSGKALLISTIVFLISVLMVVIPLSLVVSYPYSYLFEHSVLIVIPTIMFVIAYGVTLRFFKISPLYSFLSPFSLMFASFIIIKGVATSVTGKVLWKGRVYNINADR